jgi:large subunit ribosomal protein L4
LIAYRANQRQWSANTKGRSEVNHSGQKPHPQKGTGRARQGFLGAAQYKGGGRVFGPKPKFDQCVKVNKKEKQAVIKHLISQKIQDQHFHVLSVKDLTSPKTKTIVEFLEKMDLQNKRVLFVGRGFYEFEVKENDGEFEVHVVGEYVDREILIRSLRNVPKLSFSLLPSLNGYELMLHQDIVLIDEAVDEFMALLEGKKNDE